jgi:hypothetical protein
VISTPRHQIWNAGEKPIDVGQQEPVPIALALAVEEQKHVT